MISSILASVGSNRGSSEARSEETLWFDDLINTGFC